MRFALCLWACALMVFACRRESPPDQYSNPGDTLPPGTTSSHVATLPANPFGRPAPTAVENAAPHPVAEISPNRIPAARSRCDDLADSGLVIINTRRQAVVAQLGPPDSIHSTPTPNPYNPAQTDSVVDLFYSGMQLHYIVLGKKEGETDMLLRASVSDNRYLKYPELGVGASAAVILGALGEPDQRMADKFRYVCGRTMGGESPIYFHFGGDRVKLVEYNYYTD